MSKWMKLQIPESAARLVVHLRWLKAQKEMRGDDDEYGPGDSFLDREFSRVHTKALHELEAAFKLDNYNMAFGHICFNSYFNDRKLYEFLGGLYISWLFNIPENRSAFLKATGNLLTEDELQNIASSRANVVKVLESNFFVQQPDRSLDENEHLSPVLKALRSRLIDLEAFRPDEEKAEHVQVVIKHFQELKREIMGLYKLADLGPYRDLSEFETCRRDDAFSLSDEDTQRLLDASRKNEFFCALISKRPPNCGYISHEQALLECAEHARLWLLNAKLPVYYNFNLRYCDLAKADSITDVEREAFGSPVGYGAVLLSCHEKIVRRMTLNYYWDAPDTAYNLAPEDFDTLKDVNPELDLIKFTGIPVDNKEAGVLELARDAKSELKVLEKFDLRAKYEALKQMAKEMKLQAKLSDDSLEAKTGDDCVEADNKEAGDYLAEKKKAGDDSLEADMKEAGDKAEVPSTTRSTTALAAKKNEAGESSQQHEKPEQEPLLKPKRKATQGCQKAKRNEAGEAERKQGRRKKKCRRTYY